MPTALTKNTPAPKPKTPSQKVIDKAVKDAVKEALSDVGKTKFTCRLCGKLQSQDNYYRCSDPRCQTGVVSICKSCVERIVYQIDEKGNKHPPTEESIKTALQYLDKPWFDSLYQASLLEAANTLNPKQRSDVWKAYIKNVSMINYRGMRWVDGEASNPSAIAPPVVLSDEEHKEIHEMYEANRRMVINTLGYDPFETVAEKDKPLVYSKLVGLLDQGTADDEFKLGACIEIVQIMNQAESLNFVINEMERAPQSIIDNAAQIKTLTGVKKDMFASALALAKDNGISINNSKKNTKGTQTWTGQIKQLKEANLREQEVNSFEIGVATGMQQVANISAEAILKQIRLDDNDYTEMLATQREMITDLQSKAAAAEEESRLLKRENKDLKDFLAEQGMLDANGEVIANV